MRTYPMIIRRADGTETTQVFDAYQGPHPTQNPGADDARIATMSDPRAVEIEVRRVRDGEERRVSLWTRDQANGNWINRGSD